MPSSRPPDALADLPVSAELVYRVLADADDGATVAELDAELHCARSTIVSALHRLKSAGLVAQQPDPRNAHADRWVSDSAINTEI